MKQLNTKFYLQKLSKLKEDINTSGFPVHEYNDPTAMADKLAADLEFYINEVTTLDVFTHNSLKVELSCGQ